jgi:hypothetical protein
MARGKKAKSKKHLNYLKFSMIFIVLMLITFILFYNYSKFYSISKQIEPSLSCSKFGKGIRCEWKNCKLKDGKAELIIAKYPNYVEDYIVKTESGYNIFYPNDVVGQYVVVLSCEDKDIVRQLSINQ